MRLKELLWFALWTLLVAAGMTDIIAPAIFTLAKCIQDGTCKP